MADYLNYLSENQAFQNIKQFGTQQQEARTQEQQQGIFDLVEAFPLITDATDKAKDIYQRGQKLYQTGKEALGKISENIEKGKQAITEGIEKVKTGATKFQDLAQETKDKIMTNAQDIKNFTTDELNNYKSKYGEKFNTELSKLQEKKSNLAKQFSDTLEQKRAEVLNKRDELEKQLGRDLTPEERKPLLDKFTELKTELGQKFNTARNELETNLKNQFSETTTTLSKEGENIRSGIGQRISRRLGIDNFEMDPEEFNPSKLSSSMGERLVSVFRGGSAPKIPTLETPKLGISTPKIVGDLKATELKGFIPEINPLQEGSKVVGDIKIGASKALEGVKSDIGGTVSNVVSKGEGLMAEGGEIAQKASSIAGEVGGAVAETAETVGGLVAESIPVVGEVFGASLALFEGLKSLFEPKPHVFATARPAYVAGI
jgi:hypothetical protein